jgi:uncharacterized protein
MNNLVIAIISGVLIAGGTLISLVPIFPGVQIAWIGLVIFAWYHHFQSVSIWGVVVFALLVMSTFIVDLIAPALAVKGQKASREGTWGALLGGMLGVFVLGPIGILLGPFIGALLGEMIHAANSEHALRVAASSLLSFLIGTGFKLIVGTCMFVYFLLHVF